MAKNLPRASLNCLLSASLLVWSLAPPAVQHEHAGGTDLSHHHDRADAVPDAIHGACRLHRGNGWGQTDSAAAASKAIAGQASHFHFDWLGFRLMFPDPDSPTDKGQDHSTPKLLFIQAGRDSVPQVHLGSRLDKSLSLSSPDGIAIETAVACPATSCSFLRITSHPLCDRARHERSGVLLA